MFVGTLVSSAIAAFCASKSFCSIALSNEASMLAIDLAILDFSGALLPSSLSDVLASSAASSLTFNTSASVFASSAI